MVRGEEQQFENTVDRLIEYTNNVKISLLCFIQRIETEGDNVDWPTVLDNFATICGQMNTLLRYTRENRSQFVENRVVLPLTLSPDPIDDLAKLTEGRVQMVNHEMVPNYLRTKPDPEIEEFERSLQTKADAITPDAALKQVNAMNKLVDNIINSIRTNTVRADNEILSTKPYSDTKDTNDLILAMTNGKNLRIQMAMTSTVKAAESQAVTRQVPKLNTNIKAGP